MKIKTMKAGTDSVNWNKYVEEMRRQKPEQYLAGDMEGYRRGYSHGREVERQSKTDLTLAGAILIALITGGLGIVVGLALDVVRLGAS